MAHTQVKLSLDPVLSLMLNRQRTFQERLLGGGPAELSSHAKMAYIREQSLALMDEVHEALAETGWKSWATSNHINQEAYLGELADVFIFFMNMMLVADITSADLARVVIAKQDKNQKRQDDGYDGVSTKCPGCKRAYDDDAVKCRPRLLKSNGELVSEAECHMNPNSGTGTDTEACNGCQRRFNDPGTKCFPGSDPSYNWCERTGNLIDKRGNILP